VEPCVSTGFGHRRFQRNRELKWNQYVDKLMEQSRFHRNRELKWNEYVDKLMEQSFSILIKISGSDYVTVSLKFPALIM